MTSDTASIERQRLDYALGKTRVRLGQLEPEELDTLLRETLREVDLRELRGFKPLRDQLSRSPGGGVLGARKDPTETVQVTSETLLDLRDPLDLSTHVVSVSRGVHDQVIRYRRHESGEETTDWKTANDWGHNQAYIHTTQAAILVLRRPHAHSHANENLFEVRYELCKVLHRDEMAVTQVRTIHVLLSEFRAQFGDRYPRMAQGLIGELTSLAWRTLQELRSQAGSFERTVAELERLSNSVTD